MNLELNYMRQLVVAKIVETETELAVQGTIIDTLPAVIFNKLMVQLSAEARSNYSKIEQNLNLLKHHLDCIDGLTALARLDELTDSNPQPETETIIETDEELSSVLGLGTIDFSDAVWINPVKEEDENFNWDNPLDNSGHCGGRSHCYADNRWITQDNEEALTFDLSEADEEVLDILIGVGESRSRTPEFGSSDIVWVPCEFGDIHDQLNQALSGIMPGNAVEVHLIVK